MRKLQAIILSAVVALGGICPVNASEPAYGWSVNYFGELAGEDMRATHIAELSESYSYEGSKSMNIKCPDGEADDGNYIEIKNSMEYLPEAGVYTLEFYGLRNNNSIDPVVYIGNQVFAAPDMTVESVVAQNGNRNWRRYSVTFDYTPTGSNYLSIKFDNNIRSFYLDNVSLVCEGDEENLIADYGFEGVTGGEDTSDEVYDTTDYQASKFMVSNSNEALILNWKNPSTDELEKISVYDITSGEEIFLDDNLITTPSRTVFYKINDLTQGVNYQYKIVFSYKTKPDFVYYLGGKRQNPGTVSIGEWKISENRGNAGYCPTEVSVDDNEAYEGEASLKLVSNIDDSYQELISNIYQRIDRKLELELGKTYKISFWAKGENAKSKLQASMDFSKFDGKTNWYEDGTDGTYDWTYIEHEYTCSDKKQLLIFYDRLCDAIWIDDVKCYELDENKSIVGENLIADGSFENLLTSAEASFTKFEAEAGNGNIKVAFDADKNNYKGAKIYQEVFGEFEYRGILNSEIREFTITGLEQEAEYTYKLVPLNTDEKEGTAEEFTVNTLLADYIIDKPVLKKDNTEVTELSGAGEYKLSVSAKNNVIDDGFKYEMIAVLYDSEDTRVEVYSIDADIPKKIKTAPYTTKTVTVNVPDGEGYYMEVYVVNSREMLDLFYAPVTF